MRLKLNRSGNTVEAVLELSLAERRAANDLGLSTFALFRGKTLPEFELGVELPGDTNESEVRAACLNLKRQIDTRLAPSSNETFTIEDNQTPPAPENDLWHAALFEPVPWWAFIIAIATIMALLLRITTG